MATMNPTRLLNRRNQPAPTQTEPEPTVPVVRTPQPEQQRLQEEIARIDAEQAQLSGRARVVAKRRDELEEFLRGDDGWAGASHERQRG